MSDSSQTLRSLSICPVCPVCPVQPVSSFKIEYGDSGQNGPAHGSEPLSSPAPVGQSAGIWRVEAGKMYVHVLDLSL